MRYAFAPLALGIGANALVARDSQTCVQLKASGGASGTLGQLSDGQNRIGGGHPTGCYCLGSNGGFTDSNGRGCILTPPTTQFQCDEGASPTNGFAVGSGGTVTYNGKSKFYACPVNDNSEWNVYTSPAPGQAKCVEIELSSAGSCGAGAQPSKPVQSSQAVRPSQPAYSPIQPSQPAVPSQPAQPSPPASKPAPSKPAQPSTLVQKPSQPAQPSKPAESKPAYQPSPPPQPTQPKPSAPAQSQPAQPSKPAPQPSSPAPPVQSQPAPKPSAPAQSQPAPKPSAPAPAPSQPAAPQPSSPSGSCPTDLNGNYQYPHLIVPISNQSPNQASGTSYFGTVNSTTCTIFNFDIPQSYSGKTCSVVFLFPEQKDLETSSFTTSGSGNVQFSKLNGVADQKTCWANQPEKDSQLLDTAVKPGSKYVVATGECAAGQTVSYEMCSTGGYALNFFQDYNPSPIGLYVRQC